MALVSVVVPVYDNAASLPNLWGRLHALAQRQSEEDFEFLFVDDGSRDASAAVIEELAKNDDRIQLNRLTRNFGATAAVQAGLGRARGDAAAVISADLQDPPELLDQMLERWREGARVVLAVRTGRDDPLLTRLCAAGFYALFRWLALPTMPLHGFDFFLIDRPVAALLAGMEQPNAYVTGQLLWLGFRPALVPYHRQRRKTRYGRSRWSLGRKLKYAIDALAGFTRWPFTAAWLLGSGLGVVGIVCLLISLAAWSVWPAIMGGVLVIGGLNLGATGLVGEYVWRALEQVRQRPPYVADPDIGRSARASGRGRKAA